MPTTREADDAKEELRLGANSRIQDHQLELKCVRGRRPSKILKAAPAGSYQKAGLVVEQKLERLDRICDGRACRNFPSVS